MDEKLLIRQQWHALRRDLDTYRAEHSSWGAERAEKRDELTTRLSELRHRLLPLIEKSHPSTHESLRRAMGMMAIEAMVRRAVDLLVPEED